MGWNVVTASWVQAIGSVAAIFIAIALSWVTLRAEKSRTKSRGRIVTFRLAPLLGILHADVERALRCADELEPGTNDFARMNTLVGHMVLPTEIPDEIFSETSALPANVALMVAQLENALREYRILASQMTMTGSVGVWPQETRTSVLAGMKGALKSIDTYALAVSNYCVQVSRSLH
jgi:hypothetical protein